MALPRGDAVIVKLSGIPSNMTYEEIVPHLTLPTRNGQWKCLPFRPFREPSAPGTKTVLARAASMPPRDTVRLKMQGGYRIYPVSITEYITPTKQLSSLDKAAASTPNPACTRGGVAESTSAAWGATPKAKAAPARAVPKREPWANINVEEDDGQPLPDEVNMDGDAAPDDSSVGDVFDDADSGADTTNSFGRWPFGGSKAAKKEPSAGKAPNAFQEQMAAMKLRREQDTVEAAVRHRQLEDNLASLAREMEARNDALNDTVALMSDSITKAQAENARQLGAMADCFKEQMQEMFRMLSGQITNLSAGKLASDPDQDISDSEQHQTRGTDHYSDEEWQKWNDRERSPRGGARCPTLPGVPKKTAVDD